MSKPIDPFLLARSQGHVTAGQPYIPRGVQGIQALAQWRQGQQGQHAWLANIVGAGLMKLRALHLAGQPAAEQLPLTAELWCDILRDLRLSAELDTERLDTAFRRLCRTVREWPQPADLIEQMPRRTDTRRDPRDVPVRRERTETDDASAAEALAEMKNMFGGPQ